MDNDEVADFLGGGDLPHNFLDPFDCTQGEEQSADAVDVEADAPSTKVPRKKNYTQKEDKAVCSAWLEIGLDSVVGTDQNRRKFWDRIYEKYLEGVTNGLPRTRGSVEHRWQLISEQVMKYCGFFDKVERLQRSGTTLKDKHKEAMDLFKAGTGKAFAFPHCYQILKGQPKWDATLSSMRSGRGGSSKGCSQEPEDVSPGSFTALRVDDSSPSTGSEFASRPIGKKAAKKRSHDSLLSRSDQVWTEINSAAKETEERREARHKEVMDREDARHHEKSAMEARKLELIERQVKIKEEKMMQERRREEERIMAMKLDGLDEYEREYYLRWKKQILGHPP